MSRVAVVTGGTRGIGAAISKRLKADGCKVAAIYAGNDAAAAAFKTETGIAVYKCDVSSYEACTSTLKTIEMRNNVGRVGCITSRSSLESSAGESPVCLLSCSSPMLLCNRSRRSLLPIAYLFRPLVMVSDAILKDRFPLSPCRVSFFSAQESRFPVVLYSKTYFL